MCIKLMSKCLWAGVIGLTIALMACSPSMSKKECLTADWYLKGLDDGSKGRPLTLLQEHNEACSRVDVRPNRDEYFSGHEKGVRLYCVPEKGYAEGRRGAAYYDVCPSNLAADFVRAYRDGQELFSIENNINNLKYGIDSNKNRINANYAEIDQLKAEIIHADDEKERRRKLNRIDDLQMDITNLSIQIDRNYRELKLFEHDFDVVEQKHFRMGYIH